MRKLKNADDSQKFSHFLNENLNTYVLEREEEKDLPKNQKEFFGFWGYGKPR